MIGLLWRRSAPRRLAHAPPRPPPLGPSNAGPDRGTRQVTRSQPELPLPCSVSPLPKLFPNVLLNTKTDRSQSRPSCGWGIDLAASGTKTLPHLTRLGHHPQPNQQMFPHTSNFGTFESMMLHEQLAKMMMSSQMGKGGMSEMAMPRMDVSVDFPRLATRHSVLG